MSTLKIHRLNYYGDKYYFESPIMDDENIFILEAPNGCGKTTFFNLLYFGLGGKVSIFNKGSSETHSEIVNDSNNYVELIIKIEGVAYTLIRKMNENIISVISDSRDIYISGENYGKATSFKINRNTSADVIFSDWILDELNIPSIELYNAGHQFKLGFTDIMRLVYHNQGSDIKEIYKPADDANYISDSKYLRKAIFEILVGKAMMSLYKAQGAMKRKQSDYEAASAIFREFQLIVNELISQLGLKEIMNDVFLKKEINILEERIVYNQERKNKLLRDKVSSVDNTAVIDDNKRRVISLEKRVSFLSQQLDFLLNKKQTLNSVLLSIYDDVSRIQKIIHTHQQLELFTPDTCPYCLKTVERPTNKCVCGSHVEEDEYRRYFYNPNEYLSLLKSKIKSSETVKSSIADMGEDIFRVEGLLNAQKDKLNSVYAELGSLLENIDIITSYSSIENIDQEIFNDKDKLNVLLQANKLEERLKTYEQRKESVGLELKRAKAVVEKLEADAKLELLNQITSFSKKYNSLMTHSLSDCRKAIISDDNYMPVINDGSYKEASAGVHRRLLYFVTLLALSLNEEIPFPRLLLIDTPENIGIDKDQLDILLETLISLENRLNKDYQIILSTGVGKYPKTMDKYVKMRLSKSNMLLIKRG
ncbi:AAA family ATPase [Aeromonas enteropelogenes]|uniref:AAA family ATPase n=1 Tax=Aeromonas enteropelogenes TaxID=29489 RepID=UPI003BA082E8